MTEKGGMAVVFWGPHSISTEMFALHLNATLYLIHYLSWKRPWIAPLKYPPMWIKTWWVLFKQRPSAVFVINTPVFAPLCVYLYCLFARIPFAMNVHGHTLSGRRWGWSRPIQRFLAKKAAVNLVCTTEYKHILESWGAHTLFFEDPPIRPPEMRTDDLRNADGFKIAVISTFAGDEPLDLVIDAAHQLPDVRFYITGDMGLAKKEFLDSAPPNITFTDYLKGNKYWGLLFSSNAIMTLTTNPYSLVAGGVEGMYIGKPLILSCQPALVDYFTKGTVFVDHTVDAIVEGVQHARQFENTLAQESAELAVQKSVDWQNKLQNFMKILEVARG